MLVRRIRRILDSSIDVVHQYSLSKIPPQAAWNTTSNPPFLAVDGTPMKIRIIGFITSTAALPHCVEIELLRTTDHKGLIKLLRRGSPKPSTQWFSTPLHILTMSIRHISHLADDLYDATSRLRPPQYLERVAIDTLRVGDIMAIDCACIQHETESGWDVEFEPLDLFLIAKAAH
ncbi:hypothetical protein FKP32DRAFT_1559269 [Trametes sanguinea]|nr:hypothetical protein FKP32DRAFT_1559269 [Trametes sanguinea]